MESTLLYIQPEQAIFKEDSDEFVCKVTKTVEEARALIEAGYDYVWDVEDAKLFRKHK